jgi:hypothetical protein
MAINIEAKYEMKMAIRSTIYPRKWPYGELCTNRQLDLLDRNHVNLETLSYMFGKSNMWCFPSVTWWIKVSDMRKRKYRQITIVKCICIWDFKCWDMFPKSWEALVPPDKPYPHCIWNRISMLYRQSLKHILEFL